MKSGRLIETVTIERGATAINEAGTPVETWAHVCTLRAERVEFTT